MKKYPSKLVKIYKLMREMFPYGHPQFYWIVLELCQLHSNKSHDYGGATDPLYNLRQFGWKGVVVRLGDKFCRLKNFCEQAIFKVKNESVEDAFDDTAVYAILGKILKQEEDNKNK